MQSTESTRALCCSKYQRKSNGTCSTKSSNLQVKRTICKSSTSFTSSVKLEEVGPQSNQSINLIKWFARPIHQCLHQFLKMSWSIWSHLTCSKTSQKSSSIKGKQIRTGTSTSYCSKWKNNRDWSNSNWWSVESKMKLRNKRSCMNWVSIKLQSNKASSATCSESRVSSSTMRSYRKPIVNLTAFGTMWRRNSHRCSSISKGTLVEMVVS